MINDKLHIFNEEKALSQGFTGFMLTEIINEGNAANIALSGGNTPKTLFDYWSNNYSDKIPWDAIRLFWVDERCVPPDDEMSNYGMTKEHLLNRIEMPSNNIFRIHGENDAEDEVRWYSEILHSELPQNSNVPELDLIMLGLGEDGHTASIFPDRIDLWESGENCVATTHPDTDMKRISMTGKVINNARNIAFLVTGKSKAERVRDIIKSRDFLRNEYPAARVSPKNQQIHWFLDEDAASLL